MSTKKLLTIFGATGNQGGSVISVILSSTKLSSEFTLRAVTRDPSKPNAQALASRGVELTKADLNDASSIASAIQGSYGVFAVTDYWQTANKATEITQGKNIVDACKQAGVKHLVWSSLPPVTKMTNGEFTKVEHFDSKAEVAEYAASVKGDMIVSNFMPGFFMSNLLGMIKKQDNGSIALDLPWNAQNSWVPLLDIRGDTGKFVAGLFAAGKAADGVYVQGTSEWIHPQQIVDTVAAKSGQEVKFTESAMSVEIAAKMPKIPEEMMQNMMLVRDYSYFGKGTQDKQAESDRWLAEGMTTTTFKDFAKGQKWAWEG